MTHRRLVLVVCTGNICRSPMAEAFLKEHLVARGVTDVDVRSAGVQALEGHPALAEAVRAVAKIRGDASRHLARQLDFQQAGDAHLILCAAQEHKRRILSWWPDVAASRVRLFNESIADKVPADVDDPYGWDDEVFGLAARVIDRAMDAWAERLDTHRGED